MSTKGNGPEPSKRRWAGFAICWVLPILVTLGADSPLISQHAPQNQGFSSLGHQVVVLLDTNLNQRQVLPVELSLAEGVIQTLDQPENAFSVITFGSQRPVLFKSGAHADEALAAIRGVSLEQTSADYLSVRLYEALNLAFGQFTDDARPKSLLIIAEGNDGRGKSFRQTVLRSQQLHINCNVAVVADHTLYGAKAIQRYGFYLRELAGKTHGGYVEVGGRQKTVPSAVSRLCKGILAQGRSP